MRVQVLGDISSENFAKNTLILGEGKLPTKLASDLFSIPSDFCVSVPSFKDLIRHVSNKYKDHHWVCELAILAPKNENINKIIESLLKKLSGNFITYKFPDAVMDKVQAVYYLTEFLNSLNPFGMPPHMLNQKVGFSIMLLRNLDPSKLCKRTGLCASKLMSNAIQATILIGNNKGESVFIPRIPLIPSDMSFEFKSFQFPDCLAFAITINKVQGQSLRVAGINLETRCFSQDQLHVSCSRVGTPRNYMLQTARLKMSLNRML
ncbi:hypothetical protein AVEN_32797-1 [Araneus ventricosus]|uniref:DNA helicase Pif1-like 2B domain-containing protein n=1 Tax=Araneus ventricosus TaxID=182803 RepID=A0A4Y1ZV06_ARAVE|nr:hypothetical protein AVEN_32797-1 [Araneus ventricosus]